MEKDLKWIKKHYGEEMMKLCRELFPQLLEQEGLLPKLLEEHFPQNRELAHDIKEQSADYDFKSYIYSFINVETKEQYENLDKTAVEIMDNAGYILYPECKTEEDIQSFKKYYAKNEALCTFRGGRLNTCRVWFAVKKNVDEIRRENFKNPTRQDEYGTSVISIQFSRAKSFLSIKNRYNHSVNNPDNTFNSDLNNIATGLMGAFERDYNVENVNQVTNHFELEDYVRVYGKHYKYNLESNNISYCGNNILIDNFEVKKLPDSQMLVDYFIFDFKNNTISLYDKRIEDCFPESFGEIEKLEYKNGVIIVKSKGREDALIKIDNNRKIVSVTNTNLTKCGHGFMCECKGVKELNLPQLSSCGNRFLSSDRAMEELNLPKLNLCGKSFFKSNNTIKIVNLPQLQICEDGFLENIEAEKVDLPNLKRCGDDFLKSSSIIERLDLPNLRICGDSFLRTARKIKEINLPELQECGDDVFCYASKVERLNTPKLKILGARFLMMGTKLEILDLPELVECGSDCFHEDDSIKVVNTPKLQKCGSGFLFQNTKIPAFTEEDLPNFKETNLGKFYNKRLMGKLLSKLKEQNAEVRTL